MSSSTSSFEDVESVKSYLKSAVVAFCLVAGASLLAWSYPPQESTGLAIELEKTKLAIKKPEVLLLGNSMLGEGIDDLLLEQLTGQRIHKHATPGSASAYWYLYLKNVATASKAKPDAVVLFFRDFYLTEPAYRVDAPYRERILGLSHLDDPELMNRAYGNDRITVSRLLEENWPLVEWRTSLQDKVNNSGPAFVLETYIGADSSITRHAMTETFRADRNDQRTATQMELGYESMNSMTQLNFSANLPDSFLPPMIEHIQSASIRLILVRVRRRSNAEGIPEHSGLSDYISNLEDYLKANNVELLDYSNEQSIGLEHFAIGDHLNESGKEAFTRLLAKDITEITRSPAP